MGQSNTRERPPWAAQTTEGKPYSKTNSRPVQQQRIGLAQGGRAQPQQRRAPPQQKQSPPRTKQPILVTAESRTRANIGISSLTAAEQNYLKELSVKSEFGNAKHLEKAIQIEKDSQHSYESLFSPYMQDLQAVIIDEPYTQKYHQITNLIRFLESCVAHSPSLRLVKLVTKESLDSKDQLKQLKDLANNLLSNWNIKFVVEFQPGIHDRYVA